MRMIIVAGVLMLALLIAIVGSVSADNPTWVSAGVSAGGPPAAAQPARGHGV